MTRDGYTPRYVQTAATCILVSLDEGGFRIAGMELDVTAQVLGIDAETFRKVVEKADRGCPVSNLLRPGLEITLRASLAE